MVHNSLGSGKHLNFKYKMWNVVLVHSAVQLVAVCKEENYTANWAMKHFLTKDAQTVENPALDNHVVQSVQLLRYAWHSIATEMTCQSAKNSAVNIVKMYCQYYHHWHGTIFVKSHAVKVHNLGRTQAVHNEFTWLYQHVSLHWLNAPKYFCTTWLLLWLLYMTSFLWFFLFFMSIKL